MCYGWTCTPCSDAIVCGRAVKRILHIANLFPLFLGLLILSTLWKQAWQHVANRAPSGSTASKLAGAALYQS